MMGPTLNKQTIHLFFFCQPKLKSPSCQCLLWKVKKHQLQFLWHQLFAAAKCPGNCEPWLAIILEISMSWLMRRSQKQMRGRQCCTQHLYLSAVVLANTPSLTLFFQQNHWLGLILSLSLFLSVSVEVLKGVDSLAVQARPAAALPCERQRRSGARERSPIWLSPSVNTKGRSEKGPRWAGKWMALTSSNLRKHLHLLIKIEWKKVISVQGRPS